MSTDLHGFRDRAGHVGRLLVAALLGALAGAFGVFLLTRGETSRLDAAVLTARAELAGAQSNAALLESRLAVDQAQEHLDERNYGLMMRDLERAGLALARVDPGVVGGPEPLQRVRGQLDVARHDAATNPADQRAVLSALERNLALLGAPEAPEPAPAGTR